MKTGGCLDPGNILKPSTENLCCTSELLSPIIILNSVPLPTVAEASDPPAAGAAVLALLSLRALGGYSAHRRSLEAAAATIPLLRFSFTNADIVVL